MAKRCGPNIRPCGMSQGIYNPFFQNGATWYGSGGTPPLPTVSGVLGIDINPFDEDVWQDVARALPANTDGSVVGSVQYATGKYISTATAGDRPLFETNVVGGKQVLRFDGSDDALYDALHSFTNPYTVFVVVKTSVVNKIIIDSTITGANRFYFNTVTTNSQFESLGVGLGYVQAEFIIFEVVVNGASGRVGVCGVCRAGNTGSAAWAGFRLGEHASLGGFNFNGDIARILGYTGALSAADRQTIRDYLSEVYDVPLWINSDYFSGGEAIVDRAATSNGVNIVNGVPTFRQLCSGGTISGYLRISGVSTTTKISSAFFIVYSDQTSGAVGSWTANEVKHCGLCIFNTNVDNNYIGMISVAASVAGERSLQLVKQVASVETILVTGMASETLQYNTRYELEVWKTVTNTVMFNTKKEDGTSLGIISVFDTSLTTGNSGPHGFAVDYGCEPIRTRDI